MFLKSLVIIVSSGINLALADNSGLAQLNNDIIMSSPKEWFSCKSNSECVLATGICATPVGINKKYKVEFNRLALSKMKNQCVDFVPPEWPKKVICSKGKCESSTKKK